MNVPKGLARGDIEEVIEKLLKDDKVNVIVIKEDSKWKQMYCKGAEGDILVEFDKKMKPTRIIGCNEYKKEGYNVECAQYGECRLKICKTIEK